MAGHALMLRQRTPTLRLKLGGKGQQPASQEPWEPLSEGRRSQARVKLVELFSSVDLQKDYFGYTMVFDGRKFRKLVPGIHEDLTPSRDELVRFLIDIYDASEKDHKIEAYLERNPLPYRLIRRKK